MSQYEDGKKFDGSVHLINHPETEAKDRLGHHIKEFCLYYTGQKCPSGMTEEAYKRNLRSCDKADQESLILFLENYHIGVEE